MYKNDRRIEVQLNNIISLEESHKRINAHGKNLNLKQIITHNKVIKLNNADLQVIIY